MLPADVVMQEYTGLKCLWESYEPGPPAGKQDGEKVDSERVLAAQALLPVRFLQTSLNLWLMCGPQNRAGRPSQRLGI